MSYRKINYNILNIIIIFIINLNFNLRSVRFVFKIIAKNKLLPCCFVNMYFIANVLKNGLKMGLNVHCVGKILDCIRNINLYYRCNS